MATPRSRQAARLRTHRRRSHQRARRLAVLGIVAALALVTLLLTAFGSGTPDRTGLPPAATVVPAESAAPEPEVLATVGNLQIRLPVAAEEVTAIGFHGAGGDALELQPVGRQVNEGLLARLWRRIAGAPKTGPVWYQLEGSPGTEVVDVGAAPGTDVYAPVQGTIAAISDYVIDGKAYGARIDVRPTEAPSVIVSLTHVRPDPSLAVGSLTLAGSSKLGTVVDAAVVEQQALAEHARASGNNVAIEVHPAAGSLP